MRILAVGARTGIGEYLANKLQAQGHDVLRISRSASGADSLASDVSSFLNMKFCLSGLSLIRPSWKYADAMIFTAGTQGPIGRASNVNVDEWDKTVDVNLKGFFHAFRAFYELLRNSSHGGKIIAISGGGSTSSRPRFSAYAAAKCGLVRLVEVLADEEPGMQINAIAPGAIFTQMTREVLSAGPEVAGEKDYGDAVRLRDNPDPDALPRVLKLVDFLLSPESVGITGRLITAKWDNYRDKASYTDNAYRLRRISPI